MSYFGGAVEARCEHSLGAGRLAKGSARVSRVSRSAHQGGGDHGLRSLRHLALEAGARSSQPERAGDVGTEGLTRHAVASIRPDHPPLSAATLRRQTPEVGAECVISARSHLSGVAPGNRRPHRDGVGTSRFCGLPCFAPILAHRTADDGSTAIWRVNVLGRITEEFVEVVR